MANRLKGQSALAALRAGATIEGNGGNGISESEATQAKTARLEGSGNSGAPTAPTASTAPAIGNGAANPSQIFGGKRAEDYESIKRPEMGRHPKSGEPVEIDWSAPGASADAPFGLLPDGSPRVRRSNKHKKAGGAIGPASAAKSGQNVTVVADAIQFAHLMIANVTKHSHWAMSKEEATAYSDALTDLQSAYGFDIDPKQAAWVKAATVIGIPTSLRVIASIRAKPAKQNLPPPQRQQTDNSPAREAQINPAPSPPQNKPSKEPQTPSELFARSGLGVDDFSGSEPS